MKVTFLDVDGVLNCATTKELVRDLLFIEDRKVQLLKELVDEVESFVILDDDSDMKPWGSHLVKTSWAKGLQPNHIRAAKKILNERVEIK